MIKRIALAAALAVAATTTAQAHDWIVMNAGNRACEVPQPPFMTPLQYELAARDAGIFEATEIARDNDGVASVVGIKVITSNGLERVLVYFRTIALCRAALTALPGSTAELN